MKYKLLIVDDEPANLRLLERLFSSDYDCLTASSGPEAIRYLEHHDVAILVTDQRMPRMTGIELLRHTALLRPHMVRILLTGYTDVEVLVEAVNSGLVYMYVSKPWNNEDLKLKIDRAREHYESKKKSSRLALANDRLTARLREIKLVVAASLSGMLKGRDEYAHNHAVRVRALAMEIAEKMCLTANEKEDLSTAATLHHLGEGDNSSVRPSCAREFAPDQTSVGKAHSECEATLLTELPELATVWDLVRFRTENFDGTGFPEGREAERIPVASRILRVADEYDLLVQPRRTSSSLRHDEAMRFLSQRSGKQFDPQVIEILSRFSHDHSSKVATTPNSEQETQGNLDPALVDVSIA